MQRGITEEEWFMALLVEGNKQQQQQASLLSFSLYSIQATSLSIGVFHIQGGISIIHTLNPSIIPLIHFHTSQSSHLQYCSRMTA